MFDRTFYKLQAKKSIWYAGMIALVGLAVFYAPFAPVTIMGIIAGVSAFHPIYYP